MRRLITFGCSHTNHTYPTWANILGLNFDKHINFGRGGSGQLYAANALVGVQRHLNITKDDYIVMMMPEENRWDIELRYSQNGHIYEKWETFLPYHRKNGHWLGMPDWMDRLNANFGLLKSTLHINSCLKILKEIGCDYKIVLALNTKKWYPKAYLDLQKELGNDITLQEIGNKYESGYKYIGDSGNIEEDGHWIIPAHLEWVKETFPNLYDDKYDSTVMEWHSEMISEPKTHYDFEWGNVYDAGYNFEMDEVRESHWKETTKNGR